MTEDEMVGWYQLNGHEFEQAPGDGEGQGSLACCSPWGCKESDTTERLNTTNNWSRAVFSEICLIPEERRVLLGRKGVMLLAGSTVFP